MSTIGPVNFASFASDAANGGGAAWSNSAGAEADDGSFAFAGGFLGGLTHYLKAEDPSAGLSSLEDDAHVSAVQIEVRYLKSGSGTGVADNENKLIVGGVVQEDNQARGGFWPTAETAVVYTFATDLTGAEVKASGFGFAMSAAIIGNTTAIVEQIRILSVTFTEAADVEGDISVAEDLLASTIASSARFQSLVGAASEAEAKEHVYSDALPPPASGGKHSITELREKRPYALIYTDEETGLAFSHEASGVSYEYNATGGRMKFSIERDVPNALAHDPSALDRDFKNDCGVILEEMLANAGKAGYLAIERLTFSGPMRSREEVESTLGDFQVADFDLAWGTGV